MTNKPENKQKKTTTKSKLTEGKIVLKTNTITQKFPIQ